MNAIALQPELRALMFYDTLPAGCISFMCTDKSSLPHVRPGEFVVVDTQDRAPRAGELFVIKFSEDIRHHHICMVRRARHRPECWSVGAVVNNRLRELAERVRARRDLSEIDKNSIHLQAQISTGGWVDGPYSSEIGSKSYNHLCDCLVGCVIGIHTPTFEGPSRAVNAGGAI